MKRAALLLLVVAVPLGIAQAMAGCSSQGEGQICSTQNTTTTTNAYGVAQTTYNDCGPNLQCVQYACVNSVVDDGVCCPVNGASNVPACRSTGQNACTSTSSSSSSSSSGGADAGRDASSSTPITTDGGSDAATSDGSADAATSDGSADAAG